MANFIFSSDKNKILNEDKDNDLSKFLSNDQFGGQNLSIFDTKIKKESNNYSLLKPIKQSTNLHINVKKKLFEDFLYLSKAKNKKLKKIFFHVYGFKNFKAKIILLKNGGPSKYINLNNCRFSIIKTNSEDELKYFGGFSLEKNGRKLEFYSISKQSNVNWIYLIKKYCIASDFQNYYNLSKLIGKGSFARVYLAKSCSLDQLEVAVKIYNCSRLKNPELDRKLILKEINILRQLKNRGVISLLEVHEENCTVYLVLELLKGGNFKNKILQPKSAYIEDYCAAVLENLLKTLDYIHSEGIIHRDIKADNLLLRSSDNDIDVCIADFGLADYFNEECEYVFKRCGTPGYVAPEILYDWKYDYKVDIFSAGIILYSLLTGNKLFDSNSLNEIVVQNYECEIDIDNDKALKSVSLNAKNLLKKMLEKLPKDRITAFQALKHPWFEEHNEKKLKTKKAILAAVDNTKSVHNYNFENKKMPILDVKLTSKTPLLGGFDAFNDNSPLKSPPKNIEHKDITLTLPDFGHKIKNAGPEKLNKTPIKKKFMVADQILSEEEIPEEIPNEERKIKKI